MILFFLVPIDHQKFGLIYISSDIFIMKQQQLNKYKSLYNSGLHTYTNVLTIQIYLYNCHTYNTYTKRQCVKYLKHKNSLKVMLYRNKHQYTYYDNGIRHSVKIAQSRRIFLIVLKKGNSLRFRINKNFNIKTDIQGRVCISIITQVKSRV